MCDDGNVQPDDGCTSCQVDAGHVCAQLPLQATGTVGGVRAVHDSIDVAWEVVDGGKTAPAWVWDPDACNITPAGWARVSLGPAQANWLSPASGYGCLEAFPDDVPVTFGQSAVIDDAVRGPSIATVWVATDDVLETILVDEAPVAYAGDVTYEHFVRVAIPTRGMATGPTRLGFTMRDTGGQGGFLALPGPSSCAPDTDGDGLGDSGDDDSDGDGVLDVDEGVAGADPTDDHDLDGVIDAEDPDAPGFVDLDDNGVDDLLDVDGDGVPEHRDDDSGDDGLLDGDEGGAGTDPRDPDTDGGGVTDGEEVVLGTDPLDPTDDLPDTGSPPDTGADTDADTDIGTIPTSPSGTTDSPKAAQGCSCAHGSGTGWLPLALLLGLGWRRRAGRRTSPVAR